MVKCLLITLFLLDSLQGICQYDIVIEGQQVPDFTVTDQNGRQVSMKDLKGKVVLINFFATWCGPCLMELPVLQKKVWNKYKENGSFSLLVIGRGHTGEEINQFKAKNKFDLPIFPDSTKGIYSLFAKQYIPRNYLIDKNGKVVYLSQGYSEKDFAEMLDKLKSLLK